ncbi:MAG: histidine kinase [Bacteroidia bacterium]|nr:histidine kinase [Bacteroidia bacterium]
MQIPYKQLSLLIQVIFWAGYLLLATLTMSAFLPYPLVLARVLIQFCGLYTLVHLHLHILIPRYFVRQEYVRYAGWLLLLMAGISLLRMGGDLMLEQWFGRSRVDVISRPVHVAGILASGFIFLIMTAPLKLIEDWYQRRDREQQYRQGQLEAELRLLKVQVNPHFLFNALNNIYSLSFTGSPHAPAMILRLSDMMRYMLYDCRADRVPLAQEIRYLENFIELQQLKTPEPQQITFEVRGDTTGIHVPPMLFAPLFENACKHGNPEELGQGWIKAQLDTGASQLQFSIINTISTSPRRKDEAGGIGLENIRKRLELLYPGRHTLDVRQEAFTFSVLMQFPVEG